MRRWSATRERMRLPPSGSLNRRFALYGVLVTLASAGVMVIGVQQSGAMGIFVCGLGSVGIVLGLFLAVTAAFRIGPGGKLPEA